MRFFLSIVLLAAAASAEVFRFVGQQGQSSVYGVRGAVTVGAQELTGEKTALEYDGTLALEQIHEGEYLAKFTQFKLGKYNKINKNINDDSFGDIKPDQSEQGAYEREMQKPVKFSMKEGKVIRVEAQKDHQQWALNIFRGVLTLLQNQVRKPSDRSEPSVEYKYEDGITGHCKVQYEILSQPEEQTSDEVYNVTKTVDYKDCLGRPVYLHLKDVHRGCAGVCDNHKPENFLDQYEEEQSDHELRPTPGCPVNQQRKDSLVTVSNVAKYNVTNGRLDEASTQSTDIYRLYGGGIQVFTQLQLRFLNSQGPKIEEPRNGKMYNSLQQRLPAQEAEELDIPIYALFKEHSKHQQYPQYFRKHFDAVVRELGQIQQKQQQQQQRSQQGKEQQTFESPAYMVELIQAVSGMTEEELMKTIPEAVRRQQPKQLSEEEQLRRQLWIELIGKAGSKTSVKVAVEFIRNKTFTSSETRRVLQDIAGFQSYPDTDMIEELLALCTKEQGLTATGKATACVAAGKVISKACDSKVSERGQEEQQKKQSGSGRQQGWKIEEYHQNMARLSIKPQLRCTSEKLQQYVERLSQALRQSGNFKEAVAYINGLAKIQKPEALPELMAYVNGVAPNMDRFREQGEQRDESNEFIRRVAIVSLRDIATKYPKEVNPVVRVIYQNTTEQVQTRLVAFDIWMNTQPAQWEVEKVMQVANKDTSVELTHYVYTALKAAMHAEEPCYQLLAQRIRAAWSQIRPFDSGMKYSQFRSRAFYNLIEDFGVRGIWKVMNSNTTVLPAFTQMKVEQVRGPYMKTLFGAKLLVKGGDKVWDELTGKDGLLERIAQALNGQVKTGERQKQTEKLLRDITKGIDMKQVNNEMPKAVLFWKLFSGEAVIPIDAESVKELKQELLQSVTKVGKEGVSGHFVRVLVPTKAFHVEPTPMGFPIVHSTIHPIVISVRYDNIKIHSKNQEGRVLPESFELTGSINPTVLSYRQSRVFVAEKEGQNTPTLKLSGIKEFNLGFSLKMGYNWGNQRFQISIKPNFERIFHSAFCSELQLEKNTIIDEEHRASIINYGQCIKSLNEPIRRDQKIGGKQFGMTLRLTGESHQPWSGLSMLGSKDMSADGMIGAILNRVANKGMKHHSMSIHLEADKQQPMDEWSATIDMDSNIEALAKIPLKQQAEKIQKIKVQYQRRPQEQLDSELKQVLGKVEALLQKHSDEIQATTIEQQLLVKLEGRSQGQPKNTIKIAMKKINNFEKTEQQFALAAESQQSRKGIEIFGNASYPKIGSYFRFDPTFAPTDERMNGTIIATLRGQEEQTYRVNFAATKSEEQRQESELSWYEVRCLAEQKAGKTSTDACKKAILKDNSLDHMEMTIKLPNNVHPTMEQLAKQALTAVKYQFYPNMQTEISGRWDRQQQQREQQRNRREQQEIRISADASRKSAWSLLYDVRVEMPRENVTLSNIRLPGFRPVHMQLSTKQQVENVVARGEYRSSCTIGEKSVRTYDNVTFNLDTRNGCEYVLTRDLSGGRPDFIVKFKTLDQEAQSKEIEFQLGNARVMIDHFTMNDRHFNVKVNEAQFKLTFDTPVIFTNGEGERVYIRAVETSNPHTAPVVQVDTEDKKIRIRFDGRTIQTIVNSMYHGRVDGICGNNNNEQNEEFVGPSGQTFENSNEFIASYGIGQKCQIPVENTKEKMMKKLNQEIEQIREQEQRKSENMRQKMHNDFQSKNQDADWQKEMKVFSQGQDGWAMNAPSFFRQQSSEDDDEDTQVMKTSVSLDMGRYCFSTTRVPTCKLGFHKEGVLRVERIEAICVPKSNHAAHQAMQKIRQNIDIEVSDLSRHEVGRITTTVKVPKCVRR